MTAIPATDLFGSFAQRIADSQPDQPFCLGLFGGTFDPVHHGHLLLAQSAYEQYQLDGVLFIPTGLPAWKLSQHTSSPTLRLQLLQMALAGDQRFAISQAETSRPGVSYTIDTLQEMQAAAAGRARFFFIVGADSLVDMPGWKQAEEIADLVQVLYSRRPGTGSGARTRSSLSPKARFDISPIDMPMLKISSSALRQRAAAGLTLRYQVPLDVADFIQKNRIYCQNMP